MTKLLFSLGLMLLPGCTTEPDAACPTGDLTCSPAPSGKQDSFASVPDCRAVNVGDIVAREHDPNAPYQCIVSPGVQRSSQPTAGWIDSLVDPDIRQHPFKAVVNFRETWFNGEAAEVARVGMTPDNIAVIDGFTPSYQQVIDFLWFVNDPAHQPVLIHCLAGQGRTGTFTALYRMIVQGWKPSDAIDEAHRFLVNDRQIAWLWDFANNHLNDSAVTGFRNATGSH